MAEETVRHLTKNERGPRSWKGATEEKKMKV